MQKINKISSAVNTVLVESSQNKKQALTQHTQRERELLGWKKMKKRSDSLRLQSPLHMVGIATKIILMHYLWKYMQKLNKRSYPYALSTHAHFKRQLRKNSSILSILSCSQM